MQTVLNLLTSLRAKLYLLVAAVLAVLAFIARLKFVTYQRDKYRYKAEKAQAQADFRKDVDEADTEINAEYSDLRERAKADIEAGKVPENLSEPDKW